MARRCSVALERSRRILRVAPSNTESKQKRELRGVSGATYVPKSDLADHYLVAGTAPNS